MDGKSVPYERDLDLAERPILGDRAQCVNEKSETVAKSKGETEDLENAELNRRIASLLKQPRMIEFVERLRSMDEALR